MRLILMVVGLFIVIGRVVSDFDDYVDAPG